MGIGGVAGLGALYFVPGGAAPEAGRLDPVYAVPAEELEIRALGSGETLGGVLASALEPGEQQQLLLAFREQASPRRMRVGTEITLRYQPGESVSTAAERWLRGVDVALNPDETVRLTRGELGWRSALVQTPTWTDTISASGVIDDAFWTAVVRNDDLDGVPAGDRALLIHHLDQIFQWQIDFSRQIQKGDRYRFVFERQVRPDGSMRAGHVIAAELVNAGTPFHAVWFDPNGDGAGHYYDLEGKSVRRAFLRKPLEFRRISSRYTNARFHPVLKTWRAHRGVDYAAGTGTPIMTTADGVVTHRGPRGGLGNAVIIQHANGFVTRYGHMSRFAADVRVGTRVRQGQVVGYVGSTGLASGPHLHYEMWRSGKPVDPLAIDLPSGDPVPDDDRSLWESDLRVRMALLEDLAGPGDGVRYAGADRRNVDDDDETDGALPDDR
jgi:murein DD-endopeptidase MepM/ murein hydrolase activator NlpD